MAKIILITGGCGFLGSHLVNEFLCCGDYDEIRIFDLLKFNNKLIIENNESCKITSIIGDIRNYDELMVALINVTSVVHNASVVDVSLFPNIRYLKDINVNGTRTLIDACVDSGVKNLVYTSSVDVAVPFEEANKDIVIDESYPLPLRLLYTAYGQSKLEAEELVIAANNSGELKTICIRPTVLYGENDVLYVPSMLKTAKRFCGILTQMGSKVCLMQQTYAGNVAWAHVCSLRTLEKSSNVSGTSYYITDDSPPMNAFKFAEPFLKLHGYKLSKFRIPFAVINILFLIIEFFIKLIHWPLEKICGIQCAKCVNLDPCLSSLKYVTRSHIFDSSMARNKLIYSPKYDYSTALKRSTHYYANIHF